MSLIRVLTVIVTVMVAFNIAFDLRSGQQLSKYNTIVANIDGIAANPRDQKEVTLEKEIISEDDNIIRYRLGQREDGKKQLELMTFVYTFYKYIDFYLGDRLVKQISNHIQVLHPLILERHFYYNGSVISYVEVIVKQDKGLLGEANVVDGGIGNKNIYFTVDTGSTNYYSYEASFYGH